MGPSWPIRAGRVIWPSRTVEAVGQMVEIAARHGILRHSVVDAHGILKIVLSK